jgi:trigger factor
VFILSLAPHSLAQPASSNTVRETWTEILCKGNLLTTETNTPETPETATSETANPETATTEEAPNPCQRELTIEIPADVVKSETDSLVSRYTKVARIPGFRKGKVPAGVIRQRFADDIKSEIVEQLVPRYFREEAQKQGMLPVSQPRVTDLHIHEGEPIRFTAQFEVFPEFKVNPYDDINVDTIATNVTEDDVNHALENLRQQHATYTPVEEERGLENGDFGVVSFKGTPKDDPGEGEAKPVEVDEIMVEIAGENTMPEFTDNLRGAKPGETRTFDVKYADDFGDKRLAGKTLTYDVNIKAIKKKNVPELNDDFAKELSSDFNSVEELRTRLRDNMKAEKEHEAEHQGKDKIVAELVQRNEFPVPNAMLDQQIDLRLERGLRALAAQGMTTEHMKKMDFGRLRQGQREGALREVKASLILEQIADNEHIEVSDEELDREIEIMAVQSKQPLEKVRERLNEDGGLERMRHRLRNEKTLDFLYRKSA